jgi:adenine deaminase
MCTKPAIEVKRMFDALLERTRELGCTLESPFMTMSFMSLLVIPKLKLSDRGLFDVEGFQFVDVLAS